MRNDLITVTGTLIEDHPGRSLYGVALALDLLEQIEELQSRLKQLESRFQA